MFSTEIADACSIQPHHSVVCWVFKVGDLNCSYQCAEYLCVREEDEC